MSNVLAQLLLLVVNQYVLVRVPHCSQEPATLVLQNLVNELLRDVTDWIQMQRHGARCFVDKYFDEVNSCVGADHHLRLKRSSLDLINVAKLVESFVDCDLK